jgi:hypothetical protein
MLIRHLRPWKGTEARALPERGERRRCATRVRPPLSRAAARRVVTYAAVWIGIAFGVLAMQAPTEGIPFPETYRTWAHVKTVLVGPDSASFASEGGMHHIYANDKALEGYETGRFPDGAILVYDLLDVALVQGDTIEGAQRRVDVMVKHPRRYAATGGWGFGRFMGTARGEGTLSAEQQAQCFGCHRSQKDSDGVFSRFRP